jgi:GTP-binding protein YchF
MKVGIVGLEYAGKKTIFGLLTGIKKDGYSQGKEEIGVIDVPDERIEYLAQYYKPKKKTFTKIEFNLLPPVKKDADAKNNVISQAKEVDMFAVIVRDFKDENVFHPLNTIDPVRDFGTIKDEFILSDLMIVETRLERLDKQIKKQSTDPAIKERDLMAKLKENLENGVFIKNIALDPESQKVIRTLPFVTTKPIFAVVNCDEDKLNNDYKFPDGIKSINISAKMESELQELDEQAKKEFLLEMGLKDTSLNRLIRFAYGYGDLISFLTAGADEVRSWTISNGTTAQKAAGVIHSDIEKGFIRGEIVAFEDFKNTGSEAEAKKQGLYRLEGKEYIVKDGDIIEFRFNV